MAILKKNLGKLKLGIRKLGISLINSISDLSLLFYFKGDSEINARGAVQFDSANDDFAEITSPNSNLSMSSEDFVFGFFAQFASSGDLNPHLLRKYSNLGDSSINYQIFWNQSVDRFRLRIDNVISGFEIVDANNFGGVNLGTWYFVSAYYDASEQEIGISVNAGPSDTIAFTELPIVDTGKLTLGCAFDLTNGYRAFTDGAIDQLYVCKGGDLDISGIIISLYNGGSGTSYNSLTTGTIADYGISAWYELNELAGDYRDSHGTNHFIKYSGVSPIRGVVEGPANNLDPVYSWMDTINGYTLEQTGISAQPIYHSTYVDFDGANDTLIRSGELLYNINRFVHFMKFAFWDTPSAGNDMVIYSEEDASGIYQYRNYIDENNYLKCKYDGSVVATSDNPLATGILYRAAIQRNNSLFNIYVSGA